jgi:hypothetical protein
MNLNLSILLCCAALFLLPVRFAIRAADDRPPRWDTHGGS